MNKYIKKFILSDPKVNNRFYDEDESPYEVLANLYNESIDSYEERYFKINPAEAEHYVNMILKIHIHQYPVFLTHKLTMFCDLFNFDTNVIPKWYKIYLYWKLL